MSLIAEIWPNGLVERCRILEVLQHGEIIGEGIKGLDFKAFEIAATDSRCSGHCSNAEQAEFHQKERAAIVPKSFR